MNEVGVYVHIPFCVKRCLYCDFISSTKRDLVDPYLKALVKDVKSSRFLKDRSVKTLYFGGGTPSLVSSSFIERVIIEISKMAKLEPEEITIELNPESTDPDKVKDYIGIGINRASLGVQAFDDEVLKVSGRPHGTEEILKASKILRENFKNLNFDFIVGLPNYTIETVEKNLRLIEMFEPEHVSVYILDLDEDTPLKKLVDSGRLTVPENLDLLFDEMMESLESMGYRRYEISNFSKPGFESKHNLIYWKNLDYLGFGVSAGGHVGRYRYVKTMSIERYIEDPRSNSYESWNDDLQEFAETLFMGLRLVEGLKIDDLRDRFGDLIDDFLSYIHDSSYFEVNDKIKLTKSGIDRSRESLGMVVEWLYNRREGGAF